MSKTYNKQPKERTIKVFGGLHTINKQAPLVPVEVVSTDSPEVPEDVQ